MVNNRMSKAELLAHIEKLETEALARAHQMHELRMQLSIAQAFAPAPRVRGSVPSHFAAAKAMAVATGRPVKIG